jgi:hypothetical protein
MTNIQANIDNHCLKYMSNLPLGLRRGLWFTALICCFSIPGKGQPSENSKLKEVDAMDYEVYTSFFATEKLPAGELPQFFDDAVRARKIYGNTVIAKEVKPNEIAFLQKSFGEQFNSLFEDYRKNNKVEYLVKERILVPYLSIMTKEQKEKMQSGKLVEVPSQLTGEYVSLSRAGFNKSRDNALLHINWSGSAATSYYVLMRKQDNKWIIIKAEMDDMIIF